LEESLEGGEGGFPFPGTVAEVAGDDEEVGVELGEGVAPEFEAGGPAGDVEVGEVEEGDAIEGGREVMAGELEGVDVGGGEHSMILALRERHFMGG
jgi:hypothetical protein